VGAGNSLDLKMIARLNTAEVLWAASPGSPDQNRQGSGDPFLHTRHNLGSKFIPDTKGVAPVCSIPPLKEEREAWRKHPGSILGRDSSRPHQEKEILKIAFNLIMVCYLSSPVLYYSDRISIGSFTQTPALIG